MVFLKLIHLLLIVFQFLGMISLFIQNLFPQLNLVNMGGNKKVILILRTNSHTWLQ